MSTSAATSKDARFLADTNLPFCGMEVAQSFSLLSQKEKLYTYWLSKVNISFPRLETVDDAELAFFRLHGPAYLSYRGNGLHMRRTYSS